MSDGYALNQRRRERLVREDIESPRARRRKRATRRNRTAARANGVEFQDTPDTCYEAVEARMTGRREALARMQERGILIDGSTEDGILLQIFTKNVIGPIFFEMIQRKGNEGFRG